MNEFTRAMAVAGYTFGREINDEVLSIFRSVLEDYTDHEIAAALLQIVRDGCSFPPPAVIIREIGQRTQLLMLGRAFTGGGLNDAVAYIESEFIPRDRKRLTAALREMYATAGGKDFDTAVDIDRLINGIGDSDSQTPPETGQSDADSDDEPEGDTPGD